MGLGDPFSDQDRQLTVEAGLTLDEQIDDMPKHVKAEADKAVNAVAEHRLDKDQEVQRRFRRILGWWQYERARQADNRNLRYKQHEFRDGEQWDAEAAEILETTRGAKATVYNLIKPALEWVAGTERRTRVDFLVLPTKRQWAKSAEVKTKAIKFIWDVNNARFALSQAFDDAATSGLGWIEVGIRPGEDFGKEDVFVRYEDWRYVWRDSHSKQLDIDDARYLFRAKWVDYDIAVGMFPDRADAIRATLNTGNDDWSLGYDDLDTDEIDTTAQDGVLDSLTAASGMTTDEADAYRPRVKLVSCEYKVPVELNIMRASDGGDIGVLDGVEYDEDNIYMRALVDSGEARVVKSFRMVMRKMIFCGSYVLSDEQRPYDHQLFSLVPVWGYRRKKDGSPYGLVLGMMDPQDDFNKSLSKARWLLSSNQTIYETGAIEDIDEFNAEKARPDGSMEVNEIGKVLMRDRQDIASQYINMMGLSQTMVERISGVTPDNRGIPTNATSGEAIRARQEQGHVMTGPLFDNYLLAFQQVGRQILSLIEQFWTDKKTIRITGQSDKEPPAFVDINTGVPDDDITANRADFVISQESYHASIRQAMFKEFGQLMRQLPPQVSMLLLDWWVDLSDLPGKEVAIKRIRQAIGQTDPYEDPDDPKVQERRKAEAEEAQRRKQLEETMIKLEMQLKQAQASKDMAAAKKALAEAQAKMAEMNQRQQDTRIKKAEVLHKIEQTQNNREVTQ